MGRISQKPKLQTWGYRRSPKLAPRQLYMRSLLMRTHSPKLVHQQACIINLPMRERSLQPPLAQRHEVAFRAGHSSV